MLEKVARAICKANGYPPDDKVGSWMPDAEHDVVDLYGPCWKVFFNDAKAAIEALMEPTDEMERAGKLQATKNGVVTDMFGEMLREALKDD